MKNLSLVLALTIAASPAFASRARLEALGEGKNGSYYINDGRNIFLNPAQIVKHKKKLWLEFGGEPSNSDTNAQVIADSFSNSRGQGGFSNTMGDFTYGLYLNNTSDRALNTFGGSDNSSPSNSGTNPNNLIMPDSQLEAFFAGEGSLNWGISAFYAGNRDDQKKASLFGARLGVESGNLQVFTTLGLSSKTEDPTATAGQTNMVKGKISIDGGVTYAMDGWTYFGKFNTTGADVTVESGATDTTVEGTQTAFGAGFGYTKEYSKTVTMFTRLEADYATVKQGSATTSKIFNVPVVLGAEAQALSWLAVRGSVAASLFGQNITSRNDLAGTTTVAAGLGATFGDVQIDGVVASGASPAADIAGFGTGGRTSGNFGFGDNMISRVALTYNF
jgi:hypothetical protein